MSIKEPLAPLSPGEVLQELYIEPAQLSAGKVAKAIGVPRTRIERLIKGETTITTDTALRLAQFFGTTPELWLNMQASWGLSLVEEGLREEISSIKPLEFA